MPDPTWTPTRLKFLADLQSGSGITSEDIHDDGRFPVYGGNGLRGFTDQATHRGDHVLIGRQGALCGNVHRVSGDFWASEHAVVATMRSGVEFRWYAFLTHSMNLGQHSVAAAQPGLAVDRIRELPVRRPPLPVQRRIADFLDRKTAAIDGLIEKKERLLALLAEKRSALIHRAVTKGLDPSVPMKDSGVPWIGEIPAHWEVKRLKHVTSFITSGPRGWGQYYSDDGPLFLRITNVPRDGVDLLLDEDKRQSVSPPPGAEGVRTLALEGDVLVSITADLGSVGIVPPLLGEAYISQHVAMCRPSGVVLPRLLAYVVRSAWGQVHYDLSMNGGTKVGLTLDDVRNTPVVVPPALEQVALVASLDAAARRIEDARAMMDRQIERLREYRQALITAAVTGQLDPSSPNGES